MMILGRPCSYYVGLVTERPVKELRVIVDYYWGVYRITVVDSFSPNVVYGTVTVKNDGGLVVVRSLRYDAVEDQILSL